MQFGGTRSIQAYWKEVREVQRTLPETLFVASIADKHNDTPGGVLCLVDAETGAKLLVGESHRLATPEEIAAYEERQAIGARQAQRQQFAAKGFAVVGMPAKK